MGGHVYLAVLVGVGRSRYLAVLVDVGRPRCLAVLVDVGRPRLLCGIVVLATGIGSEVVKGKGWGGRAEGRRSVEEVRRREERMSETLR